MKGKKVIQRMAETYLKIDENGPNDLVPRVGPV
jgi:hypothetical protein